MSTKNWSKLKYLSLFWTFQLPLHNVLSSRKTDTSDFCYCTKEKKGIRERSTLKRHLIRCVRPATFLRIAHDQRSSWRVMEEKFTRKQASINGDVRDWIVLLWTRARWVVVLSGIIVSQRCCKYVVGRRSDLIEGIQNSSFVICAPNILDMKILHSNTLRWQHGFELIMGNFVLAPKGYLIQSVSFFFLLLQEKLFQSNSLNMG